MLKLSRIMSRVEERVCPRSKVFQRIRNELNIIRKANLSFCYLLTKIDNFLIILDMMTKDSM